MRRLLFIAYYFPPVGGGGVQRSLKFVRYLPEFGFEPLVLTAASPRQARWTPHDPALAGQLPDTTRIFRTNVIRASERDCRREARVRAWLGLDSPFGAEWKRTALALGAELCTREKPDLIVVTVSPFEGTAIAAELSRRHGIPWVADLRDPWALDEMQVWISGLHHALERRRMRATLRSAALIVMNTPEAARRVRVAYPELRDRRIISLTNGFDADDFATALPTRTDPRFTLVHTGTLHTGRGHEVVRHRKSYERLGRITRGVDLQSRSHHFLLQALERWLAAEPRAAGRVRLVLAGTSSPADHATAAASRVADLVELPGYLTHADTLHLQRTADLLFLPMHTLRPGERATIVPGKAYEYLATGRPILAAVPAGDARDFLTRAGTGLCCEPQDVDAMVKILSQQFGAWQAGRETVAVDRAYIAGFERRELTRRLATELTAIPQRPSAPLSEPALV